MAGILARFHPQVATWFEEVFAAPTAVQEEAWTAISSGRHALMVAPTGSGKTLAAFLWAINELTERGGQTTLGFDPGDAGAREPAEVTPDRRGVSVLYISPLKALGVDVENNLRAPLTGIARVAHRMGRPAPDVTVAVRSGDTSPAERARQARTPPDILITTPESAYLMATSRAGRILDTVHTVIVDEIHALAGTKRGAHLALTLERIAKRAGEMQRIGLSATVRPLEEVAGFLGGDRAVEIIAPPQRKRWDIAVHVPVEDMSDVPLPETSSAISSGVVDDPLGLALEPPGEGGESGSGGTTPARPGGLAAASADKESALPQAGSIWPFIEADLYREIMGSRSTLVFVNSRRSAERLTSRLNELWAKEHDPESLSAPLRRDPAQVMKSVDVAGTAPSVIARAHHGSVSKDERALTETMLKEGRLKAVVATSSLELGIDMGAVDLVVQVESPPSVASGLQRVGRAGHTVGAVSRGSFYPKHRQDLVSTTVVVDGMMRGRIEKVHAPRNPLDVLTQQTVAEAAAAELRGEKLLDDEWYATVRRSFPFRELDREVFDSVLDLVSGNYPATDFAELKPRVIHDAVTGQLTARPGAQRVAVTSGGTIPDRGMFGVFLVGSGDRAEGGSEPRRVGELDEEMVYESRAGDVFTLGASSWRIDEITRDRVLVVPAPGHTGRLPFWNGDHAGRPYELGVELGRFRREILAAAEADGDPARGSGGDGDAEPEADGSAATGPGADTRAEPGGAALSWLAGLGLDARARRNLVAYLREQREATGVLPDERTLVLERFRDEVGDWRIVLHTPFGRGVNAAWALAVGARIAEQTGMDTQAVAGDDGIVIRLPEGDHDPGAELFLFDADSVGETVAARVGDSALFAARFRECAARALLLPRRNPGKRSPLWQQRQRAEQLLDVARRYPSFPIILETVRECLQDVYDLPALERVCRDLGARRIRIAEVTTDQPSPFASSVLFTYAGAFMYNGDTPAAEKRVAALALDPTLLSKLLGPVELGELLDPDVLAQTEAELQHTAPGRRARSPEELIDVLRTVGPIPTQELDRHTEFSSSGLEVGHGLDPRRVMTVRIGGRPHIALVTDAALLRDGLGIPVPPGVPARIETVEDALDQLVARWVRARGPFAPADLARAFGLSISMALTELNRLVEARRVVAGRFRPGAEGDEYCAAEVLSRIRRRSLAAARAQAQPVTPSAYARFLPSWQRVAPVGTRPELRGVDGTFSVIEQLAGVRLSASAWETLVLPARVRDFDPSMLDELTSSGEIIMQGAGAAGSHDPWIRLVPADLPELLEDTSVEEATWSMAQTRILDLLSGGGAFLAAELADQVGVPVADLGGELWPLFEAGRITPDSFARIRARLAGSPTRTAHRSRRRAARSRFRIARPGMAPSPARLSAPPELMGRWSAVPAAPATGEQTARSVVLAEGWIERYGVVTRGSVLAEDVAGGFARAYRVLARFEENGRAVRGYLIEGLGAAQFSTPTIVDRLRAAGDSPDVTGWPSGTKEPDVVVLAAADPANPYGAALPWPVQGPSRSAGAMVVLIDGLLAAFLTRGGRRMTLFLDSWPEDVGEPDEAIVARVVRALAVVVRAHRLRPLVVEWVDGQRALGHPFAEAFRRAGATLSPRGIRIGGDPAPAAPRRGRSLGEAIDDLG